MTLPQKNTALAIAIIIGLISLPLSPPHSWAEDLPSIPNLHVPSAADSELPSGAVRRFGPTAFRHGHVAPSVFSPAEPFFSPNGDTVYVPGNFSLLAFDTATGRVRFNYRYSLLNVTIHNEGEAGVRINFQQGPLAGQFVVLEHTTGRELSRGKQIVLKGSRVYLEFAGGRRALALNTQRGDFRRGERDEPKSVLFDALGQKVLTELGIGGRIHNSILSPDRRRLAFVTEEPELRVFDTEDGRLLRSLSLGLRSSGEQTAPVWSGDGKTVYLLRRHDGSVEVVALNIDSGAVRVLARDERKLVHSSCVVSPDGALLAYQLDDNPWEQNSYWRILRLSDLSEAHVVDVRPNATVAAFSPDSKSFWLLSASGLARFDLATGKLDPLSADSLSHTEALAFSRDGSRLYTVAGAQVITWDVATGRECEPRTGFDDYYRARAHMRCLHVSEDGRRTIWSGNSHIHSLENGRKIGEFYAANTYPHRTFDLTPNNEWIVHDAYYGELQVANLWTGKTMHELRPKVKPRESYVMALAPDNRTLAVFHRESRTFREEGEVEIEFWDLDMGHKFGRLRAAGGGQMTMQFSQDSRELRIFQRGEVSYWDIATKTLTHRRQEGFNSYSIASTPNRHWHLRHLGGMSQLELVDVHTGKTARTWNYPEGNISAIAFSRDNQTMAIASFGTSAALYRLYEPRPQNSTLGEKSATQLTDMLGDADTAQAYKALSELIQRGDNCLPALHASLPRGPSPKTKVTEVSREQVTTYRVVEILAAIGTPAARKVLKQLADGDAGLTLTQEARATLARQR